MTRTIPHEAGHAVIGLALDADMLEWIAIYVFRYGVPGGGCKWGEKPPPPERQLMISAAGMAAEKLKYGDYLAETARIDKADLTRLGLDPTKLPELLTRCGETIQNHESAWKELQQLLYERTVKDLTNRIDAIRQGEVDVGVVTGQEARDIFAGKAITT